MPMIHLVRLTIFHLLKEDFDTGKVHWHLEVERVIQNFVDANVRYNRSRSELLLYSNANSTAEKQTSRELHDNEGDIDADNTRTTGQ